MQTENPADFGNSLAAGSPNNENGQVVGSGADLDRCGADAQSREHGEGPAGVGRAAHGGDHVTDWVAGQRQGSRDAEGPGEAEVGSRVSHGRSPSCGPNRSEPLATACTFKPFGSVTRA